MCLEAIASAIEIRLQLMPYVAAVKHRDGLPITDLRQEARVLAGTKKAAGEAGLEWPSLRPLVRRVIRLSKVVQRSAPPVAETATLDLGGLRLAVRTAGAQLIAELGRCQRALRQPGATVRLRQALAPLTASLPLPAAELQDLAAAVRRVRAG